MSEEKSVNSGEIAERVMELAQCLQMGESAEADRLLDEITRLREQSLFHELGKLTRQFHDALNSFRLDSRIASLAEQEIPDARERLRHVVAMTARSADRSLGAAESALTVCDTIGEETSELKGQWERFVQRQMAAEEFRDMSRRLSGFFHDLDGNVGMLRGNLNDVIMAQDFQDLTGQIIDRVINLVDDMERNLVDLIRISGQKMAPVQEKPQVEGGRDISPSGPPVPGVDKADVVSGQDEVDDLLSSLGF